MGRQFHAVATATQKATVALAEYRFVAYDGGYPSAAGGAKDCRGINHTPAAVGEYIELTTHGSGLVEAGEAIAQYAYVKPATDGTGRAVNGTATNNCGRAMEAASGAGAVVECEIQRHRTT